MLSAAAPRGAGLDRSSASPVLVIWDRNRPFDVAASYQIWRHRRQQSGMAGMLAPRCRYQDEDGAQQEHCRYAQGRCRPEEPRLARRHARLQFSERASTGSAIC